MGKVKIIYLINGVVRHDVFVAANTSVTMSEDGKTVVDLINADGEVFYSAVYRKVEKVVREGL